jgi:23S rRNA (cytidine1920-2'-O)/16S rRNA (cytidine1409-2'-O)-methyltransferase
VWLRAQTDRALAGEELAAAVQRAVQEGPQ